LVRGGGSDQRIAEQLNAGKTASDRIERAIQYIILLKEAGCSSNPGKGTEGEKVRLPGEVVVAKVRKGILNH